ncbi:MAG: hypothetical protein PHS41_10870, partial [Victivallaceae bacterium]|nr:hypothetical protein [Victivallaceae bacterium]
EIYDSLCRAGDPDADKSWNCPGITASVGRNAEGWTCTVTVPETSLPGFSADAFPVNFARCRALRDQAEEYYHWSPIPSKRFHDLVNFGVMNLKTRPETNLILNGDFQEPAQGTNSLAAHWSGSVANPHQFPGTRMTLDTKIFMKGGQSVHLSSTDGGYVEFYQKLPGLKKNTRYKISYALRTRDIASAQNQGAIAVLYYGPGRYAYLPQASVMGTFPWHQVVAEVVTPEDFDLDKTRLCFRIQKCTGDAWFDQVSLEEIK